MTTITTYPTENPVDYLIRKLGMTRAAFTKAFGFGENHLLLTAQGRKEGVGPSLTAALYLAADRNGIDIGNLLQEKYGIDSLDMAWAQWRTVQRERMNLPEIRSGVGSPMARLVRHFGSISQTAKGLRVRDIMVRKYMNQPQMPIPIRDALVDIEGVDYMLEFERKQIAYFKDRGRKR